MSYTTKLILLNYGEVSHRHFQSKYIRKTLLDSSSVFYIKPLLHYLRHLLPSAYLCGLRQYMDASLQLFPFERVRLDEVQNL